MNLLCTLAALLASGLVSVDERRVGDGFVVEPETLRTLLADRTARANLHIIDVRPAAAFETRRLAHSVWLDLDAWQKAAREDGFDPATWHKRIGALGIHPTDPVAILDDGKMTEAARVWFLLKLFGQQDAAVVDGGFALADKILPAGDFESGKAAAPAPVRYEVGSDEKHPVGLADKNDVRKAIADKKVQILDVRSPEEFVGADLHKNPRGGHIPGAINVPHTRLLDESGRLRSSAEVKKLLEDAGLKPDAPIIAHCQSGGRAALAALAAARAGFRNISNYYMSFGEWSADTACPLIPPASQPAKHPPAKPS